MVDGCRRDDGAQRVVTRVRLEGEVYWPEMRLHWRLGERGDVVVPELQLGQCATLDAREHVVVPDRGCVLNREHQVPAAQAANEAESETPMRTMRTFCWP